MNVGLLCWSNLLTDIIGYFCSDVMPTMLRNT